MVAENKNVRLSLGITFKILSTWKWNTSHCQVFNPQYLQKKDLKTTHLSLKVHVQDSVRLVHDQELQSS